jgi:hypothetical protein
MGILNGPLMVLIEIYVYSRNLENRRCMDELKAGLKPNIRNINPVGLKPKVTREMRNVPGMYLPPERALGEG